MQRFEQNPVGASAQGAGWTTGQPAGASDLDFLSAERRNDEFERAQTHTRRVRLLKILMPVFGVLIIIAIVAALLIRQLLADAINVDAIVLQDGKLVMENPNLNGVDGDKRPFSLSADRAIQDADQPKRVELIKINASLPMENGEFAEITAGNGVYDADKKTLRISQDIVVETTDGMSIQLEDADVDIGEGWMRTANPIAAQSRQADIYSDSMFIENNGKRLVFEGRVKMMLRPAEMRKSEKKEVKDE